MRVATENRAQQRNSVDCSTEIRKAEEAHRFFFFLAYFQFPCRRRELRGSQDICCFVEVIRFVCVPFFFSTLFNLSLFSGGNS